jgi:hypothetical protein
VFPINHCPIAWLKPGVNEKRVGVIKMETETVKLINVLRRIARGANYASWAKPAPDAVRFCVTQYNKVLTRLIELEPNIRTLFTPLPEDASADIVRIAARELAAYFEDEAPEPDVFRFSFGCGSGRRRGRSRRGCGPIAVHCE